MLCRIAATADGQGLVDHQSLRPTTKPCHRSPKLEVFRAFSRQTLYNMRVLKRQIRPVDLLNQRRCETHAAEDEQVGNEGAIRTEFR